jgi:peptidoglycan-associated lipoprotein
MSFRSSSGSVLALAALLAFGATACSKKTAPNPASDPKLQSTGTDSGRSDETSASSSSVPTELNDIYFDYDQSLLRGDAIATLSSNGKALEDDPAMRVTLEGHCDERGTVEYNLALGDRRARAAREFLTKLGIDGSRLSTVSYGEERPFASGHDESAWRQNRRVHFSRGSRSGDGSRVG